MPVALAFSLFFVEGIVQNLIIDVSQESRTSGLANLFARCRDERSEYRHGKEQVASKVSQTTNFIDFLHGIFIVSFLVSQGLRNRVEKSRRANSRFGSNSKSRRP